MFGIQSTSPTSPLAPPAMADIVPTQRENKKETFEALCSDFNIDVKVQELLIQSPMENLEDLRFYFLSEDQIDAFVAQDTSLKDAVLRIQVARMRRAWSAICSTSLKREAGKSSSAAIGLDDMLEEATLRDVKVNFWRRYRLRYPTEIMPADSLVSRCYRELDLRLLTVFDVWTVRNLMHQVTSNKKRKQLAMDLYTYEEEPTTAPSRSPGQYLSLLHTYLLALAIAGSSKAPGAPVEPEAYGGDPTKYVSVPWDILEAYYFRVVRSSQGLSEGARAGWIEKMDIAERAAWVSQFREGGATLGRVVQEVYDKRDAHWEAPPAVQTQPFRDNNYGPRNQPRGGEPSTPQKHPPPGNGRNKGRSDSNKGKGKGKDKGKLPPGTVSTTLRDGKKICSDFQKGTCRDQKKASCSFGLYKCAKVTAAGRICGMNHHGAFECRQK